MDGDAVRKRVAALAADCLAMARCQGGEKIPERAVAFVAPVELLVGALQETLSGKERPFVFLREGDVNG